MGLGIGRIDPEVEDTEENTNRQRLRDRVRPVHDLSDQRTQYLMSKRVNLVVTPGLGD